MSIPYAVETKNLSKNFGSLKAVDDLNLTINSGEIFGFLGPNGAGKSTSINMICGLLSPTSGEVLINGKRIDNSHSTSRTVGLCPQDNIFWPMMTCLEQLTFMGAMYGLPRTDTKKSSIKLLADMGLSDKKNKLAKTLSGGMKRRLNICLALVHDPEIVIFDEPEAGLDPQSRVMVREYIHMLTAKKTIILTTHNMDEAERLAQRVAIIDNGKLLLTDTPENLKRHNGEEDILELSLPDENVSPEKAKALLKDMNGIISTESNRVLIKSKQCLALLPEIMNRLSVNGISIKQVQVRKNTLEDVFIKLTGRKLRE
ncbi:MAG: ABC transporter ATP-binding protein [Bacteroidales bacterium]|nr:MAG: ABC transporter ATP-binding protein [Bacteroidales bacterium]